MTKTPGTVVLTWGAIFLVIVVPLFAAAQSPLLAWRDPIYIAAGFAGILAMSLLFLQPLLAHGALPWAAGRQGRRLHRVAGATIVLCVAAHVTGLWITSPPDVIDVLLFRSPTPFAIWGAVAMWAVIATAILAVRRKRWQPSAFRRLHAVLAAVIAIGTVIHAIQIEGTMETFSKYVLAMLVLVANGIVIWGVFLARRRG